jgi:hypothetical protein
VEVQVEIWAVQVWVARVAVVARVAPVAVVARVEGRLCNGGIRRGRIAFGSRFRMGTAKP